jgi:hypothetical protein
MKRFLSTDKYSFHYDGIGAGWKLFHAATARMRSLQDLSVQHGSIRGEHGADFFALARFGAAGRCFMPPQGDLRHYSVFCADMT